MELHIYSFGIGTNGVYRSPFADSTESLVSFLLNRRLNFNRICELISVETIKLRDAQRLQAEDVPFCSVVCTAGRKISLVCVNHVESGVIKFKSLAIVFLF